MRERRREAQPSGIKTFGSTFKNPEDERAEGRSAGQLLEAAGCRGLRHGGARFAEKHANFVENIGEASTADVLELMAAGRRRVHERFGVELEPEVQVLGEVALARRLGAVSARLLAAVAVVLAVVAVAFYFRSSATRPSRRAVQVPEPTATIGSGEEAVAVRRDGAIVRWLPLPDEPALPQLPLSETAEGRPPGRPDAGTGAGPRRRPAGPASLPAEQLLRRKRGRRRTHLGDRTALRRRLAGRAEVEGGGGGTRRSIDRPRSIM